MIYGSAVTYGEIPALLLIDGRKVFECLWASILSLIKYMHIILYAYNTIFSWILWEPKVHLVTDSQQSISLFIITCSSSTQSPYGLKICTSSCIFDIFIWVDRQTITQKFSTNSSLWICVTPDCTPISQFLSGCPNQRTER